MLPTIFFSSFSFFFFSSPLLPFSFLSIFFFFPFIPALNNYEMNGRTLRVDFAENEKTSMQGGGGGGGMCEFSNTRIA